MKHNLALHLSAPRSSGCYVVCMQDPPWDQAWQRKAELSKTAVINDGARSTINTTQVKQSYNQTYTVTYWVWLNIITKEKPAFFNFSQLKTWKFRVL